MPSFSEAETQTLIAVLDLMDAGQVADAATLAAHAGYFCKYKVDWTDALVTLVARGLLGQDGTEYRLTAQGRAAADAERKRRPPMWYWYNQFYEATRCSAAYSVFCQRVFGRDFSQHGFADMAQLGKLLQVTALSPGKQVLDLGCGNGAVDEYISDATGAHVTGVDYIPEAIQQAQERTQGKESHLAFLVRDMGRLGLPPHHFDTIISIDTLYFTDLDETVEQLLSLWREGGQMAFLYSHGADPAVPVEVFDRTTLPPDRTPLGSALRRRGLRLRTWDFTIADYQQAQRMKLALQELRPQLEAEGNLFLYENRLAEAQGIMAAFEAGAHARYLYHVTAPSKMFAGPRAQPATASHGQGAAHSHLVRVVRDYQSPYGEPWAMRAGDRLRAMDKESEWPGWVWCTDTAERSRWVPAAYVRREGDACVALFDYEATELSVHAGEHLWAYQEESGWLWCRDASGRRGWVPADCVEPLPPSV